ncbi:DUF3093 domain-containing protein [Nocardioides sp.]|uniref:DUF3093 domain-containing protein n=1 Tax=Nocardioides sp. TaxID=35761 RepID=UPI002C032E15|nr:DUF3093 domain-containing protein [Nocardioides sp.]HXH80809.1 DUF3093 domain-containing protein [Nocardioides sp.]
MEFAERLSVPLRWWAQGTMMVATLWLALVVAVPLTLAWVVTGVAMALLSALFISYGAARVSVGDGVLQAGRAQIATEHLGAVTPLDPEAMRLLAGRDADARAFLLLRPYLKRGVRVDLDDPSDPAPYWLISSRHPDRLAAALVAATPSSRQRPGSSG